MDMFLKEMMSPYRYQQAVEILNISSRESDQSPLFSCREAFTVFIVPPVNLSMVLGQWTWPPSTFVLFANGAAKLLNYNYLFLAAILST